MSEHRRQFLVGPRPVLVRADWQTVPLDARAGTVLSHCPQLPVTVAGERHAPRVLIGDALAAGTDRRTPAEQLASAASSEAVLAASRDWSGRWALILDDQLHMDAVGMLGIAYRTEPAPLDWDSPRQVTWASSSVALLARADIGGDPGTRAPELRNGVGFDWYPGPGTSFEHVHRLLASQVLELRDGRNAPAVTSRPLPSAGEYVGEADPEQQLQSIHDLLVGGAMAAAASGRPLWLPLTGGYDSRMLLTTLVDAGITDVTAFTQTYPWPKLSRADRELPPMLARAVGVEHRFLGPTRDPGDRPSKYDLHTGGMVHDADRSFWSLGQWEAIPADAVVLRGAVFEVVSTSYWNDMPGHIRVDPRLPVDPVPAGIAETLRQSFHVDHWNPGSAPHETGLHAWESWIERSPTVGLDWRDRYFLEQRVGCWASSVAQGLDITGTSRVYLANSHTLLSTALALPIDLMWASTWQVTLMQRMSPALAAFPFKPEDPFVQRLARRVQYERRAMAAAPAKLPYLRRRARTVVKRLRAGTGHL